MAAFDIVGWIPRIAAAGVAIAVVVTLALRIARRDATAWLAVFLPILVSVMTAVMYAPLFVVNGRRLDRVAGEVREPIPELRALVIAIVTTLALAAVFLAMARPQMSARRSALAVPIVVCTILTSLYFLFLILPLARGWMPSEWERRDRFVAFRPCRGALLWDESGPYPHAFVRVDDIWLRFRDPRKGGAPVWAISGPSLFRERDYRWFDRADANAFRMRSDDPAVIRCDARAHPEPVAPATWHQVGRDRW